MKKILGLDLGTNSIGWAIREINEKNNSGNQIIDYGVLTFRKGVGDGKSGEYSLAKERRENRSKRRLYNAKRYRKWALLKVLIENNMCPLKLEELRLWSVGNWVRVDGKNKNKGREYPVNNKNFLAWLAMDFENIYKDYQKLKPIFNNPYELKVFLLNNKLNDDEKSKFMIGRALYHSVQRRGFQTNRKSGASSYEPNEYIKAKRVENSDKSISEIWLEGLNKENKRIRGQGTIQREEYKKEFFSICEKQNLKNELIKELERAIYFVRPLRSQKGLVGRCTLQPNKFRIQISHPLFEEFRALSFINNIKWRKISEKKTSKFEFLPIEIKKKVLKNCFFKTNNSINFEEIRKKIDTNKEYEFNYSDDTSVSICPVTYKISKVLKEICELQFIEGEDEYGINWENFSIPYKQKVRTIKRKEGKNKKIKNKLDFFEIWHLIYEHENFNENDNYLSEILSRTSLSEEQIKDLTDIKLPSGYASLSKYVINKILVYLRRGLIYDKSVFYSNINYVFGDKFFEENKDKILKIISEAVDQVQNEKVKLNLVNSLIKNYWDEYYNKINRDYKVDEKKKTEIEIKLKNIISEKTWGNYTEEEKSDTLGFVISRFEKFIRAEQSNEEMASFNPDLQSNIVNDFYKLPRMDEEIKIALINNFMVDENNFKKMYHPSDIEIYPKATEEKLGNPMPPSKGWKNPMAMKTMHILRKLLNYLISVNKIDRSTVVVLEAARELNNANYRSAYYEYNRIRERENRTYEEEIKVLLNGSDPTPLQVDIYRLWKEQQSMCLYTGKTIPVSELYNGTQYNLEHTIPATISFDNELKNLTIADSEYNRNVKGNKFPSECPNYEESRICKTNNGEQECQPILENVNRIFYPIYKKYKDDYEKLKNKNIPSWQADQKAENIKKRHLTKFYLDYWRKKYETFTIKKEEYSSRWKNSQLIDTQLIAKYSRAYLKSYFDKVYVQKGTVTNIFSKIYGIIDDEKKDRSKHSHHAIDAAILTVIPGSATRDKILEKYFTELEMGKKYKDKPIGYPDFHISHILQIRENILVNRLTFDRTLTETKKILRNRGKIVYVKTKKGEKTPVLLQGDSIRGKLHKESTFGIIKVVKRDKQNKVLRDSNGYYEYERDKNDNPIHWVVVNKKIEDIDLKKDVIVDPVLKEHLLNQISKGSNQNELKDFNGNLIRHLRCRVKLGRGYAGIDKLIQYKSQTFKSQSEYKNKYYSSVDENYLYNIYEDKNGNRKTEILDLFKIAQKGEVKKDEILKDYSLKYSLKVGDILLMYEETQEELKNLSKDNLYKRLYFVYKFNDVSNVFYLFLQNIIEARKDDEIGDGDTILKVKEYQPRLKLKADRLNFIVNSIDFKLNLDGTIKFLF